MRYIEEVHEIFLASETLFHIGSFPFTNTLLLSLIVVAFIVFGSYFLSKKYQLKPGSEQNLVEVVYEAIIDLMVSVLGDKHKAERYLPFIATIFIFILLSNWFGILPGVGSIGFFEENHGSEHATFVPLLRSPASDLNFTLGLAAMTVVAINIFGIAALGAKAHISKFFNFSSPVGFFMGILELISEAARMISFAFRLFGNVFAGEVLLIVIAFLAPYIAPVPFLFLEIFVGFIQALVFSMLTLMFIAVAIMPHEQEYHKA